MADPERIQLPRRTTIAHAGLGSEQPRRQKSSHRRTQEPSASANGHENVAAFKPLDEIDYGILTSLIGFWVNRANLVLRDSFHRHLAHIKLRPVEAAAIIIIGQNRHLSQVVLAEALCSDQSTLVNLLLRLERRSLIARKRLTADRRYQLVSLTNLGQKFKTMIEDRLTLHNANFASSLTKSEQRYFLSVLKRIVKTEIKPVRKKPRRSIAARNLEDARTEV